MDLKELQAENAHLKKQLFWRDYGVDFLNHALEDYLQHYRTDKKLIQKLDEMKLTWMVSDEYIKTEEFNFNIDLNDVHFSLGPDMGWKLYVIFGKKLWSAEKPNTDPEVLKYLAFVAWLDSQVKRFYVKCKRPPSKQRR